MQLMLCVIRYNELEPQAFPVQMGCVVLQCVLGQPEVSSQSVLPRAPPHRRHPAGILTSCPARICSPPQSDTWQPVSFLNSPKAARWLLAPPHLDGTGLFVRGGLWTPTQRWWSSFELCQNASVHSKDNGPVKPAGQNICKQQRGHLLFMGYQEHLMWQINEENKM